jgi:hypothetical protein
MNAMSKRLFLFASLLGLFAPAAFGLGCDGSGNCYVLASATGTHSGANWTNAYTGFGTGGTQVNPASLTRGVTYWVGTGSYTAPNFSTSDSGTTRIFIEGVTAANHGPAGDWSSGFAGQAVFSNETSFTTDYWTVNGQAVSGCSYPSNNTACYTLKFWNVNTSCPNDCGAINLYDSSHFTAQYVEIEGTGSGFPNNNSTADKCSSDNCGIWQDDAIYQQSSSSGTCSYLYVGHSYAHHTGNTQFQMNYGLNDWATFEYNWISYNHTGQNGGHDEGFAAVFSDLTVRYNVFQDIDYNGNLADSDAGTVTITNWYFYGNISFWDAAYRALNLGSYGIGIQNWGIVDMLGDNYNGVLYVVHNTLDGYTNGILYDSQELSGPPHNSGQNGTITGNIVTYDEDNLLVGGSNTNPSCWGNGGYFWNSIPGMTYTWDYNAYYQGVASSCYSDTNTHGYIVSGAGANPFVNETASTIAGFALTTPDPFLSHPGVSISNVGSSTYYDGNVTTAVHNFNVDMNGNTFGANGTIDRGALQLPLSGPPVAAPATQVFAKAQ